MSNARLLTRNIRYSRTWRSYHCLDRLAITWVDARMRSVMVGNRCVAL